MNILMCVSFTNFYWFTGHAAKYPYLPLINSRVACTGMLGTGTYVIAIFDKELLWGDVIVMKTYIL
jgi:hypothetical protein